MPQIPITEQYAAAVGKWCEKVENRSLLLDKFAFPKMWGEDAKENSAFEWSLMRVASNGPELLRQRAQRLARPGRNVQEPKAEAMKTAAGVCQRLAETAVGSGLEKSRQAHTRRFLELLRDNHDSSRLRIVHAKLEGRLAINLAEGLIQNAGISLDRIFGLPLIPGSAVKGVTRAAALEETKSNPKLLETFVRVFGVGVDDWKGDLRGFAGQRKECSLPDDLKGAVDFVQAMPVNDAKIVVDIVNVHTPDYYRRGREDDLRIEKPMPNYFPAVEVGAEFAFPILLNGMRDDPSLLAAAEAWLKTALTENGLGAKTGAGYGWFSDVTAGRDAEMAGIRAAKRAKEEAAKAAASATVDEARMQEFDEMKDTDFAGILNKYKKDDEKWWPDEEPYTNAVYQRSVLEAAIRRNLPGKNAQKAKGFLARKFKVELP